MLVTFLQLTKTHFYVSCENLTNAGVSNALQLGIDRQDYRK